MPSQRDKGASCVCRCLAPDFCFHLWRLCGVLADGGPITKSKSLAHDSVVPPLLPSLTARIMTWSLSLSSPSMLPRCRTLYRHTPIPAHRNYASSALHFYANKQLELYAAKETKRLTLRQLVRDQGARGEPHSHNATRFSSGGL